jgi:hypothetical protein
MRTSIESGTCGECNHLADRRDLVVIHPLSPLRCKDTTACARRQKRDKILAEMQEMANKPALHPVDKFSRTSIAICTAFFTFVITIGLAYLWFGV